MPGLSKVIVLDPDVRASRQVQLGFEREGVPTEALPADPATLHLPGDDVGLVVVGGGEGQGLELVRHTRKLLDDRRIDAPIVFAGRGALRSNARAAGADEVVQKPAFLRDLVTIGRLLRGVPSGRRGRLAGNLAELTGLFTLIRALAALGRSATLTLIRGIRRGEIRFYHGEVTSAQVGMSHGQAALHQLLLWTDARFTFYHENIVRRQQIPLTHEELLADAERFLEGVCDSSGGLSPAMVLVQDIEHMQRLGTQVPAEVLGVLRMFDGHRVLADVLEDSAYRVFETLRVAQRAVEVGLLRVVHQERRATWRAILSIEEWLVGGEPPDRAVDPGPAPDTQAIDWGKLVPRVIGAEVGPLAGVVPAAHVSGEIVATPPAARHGTPDAQPTIVFDEAAHLPRDAHAHAARGVEATAHPPRAPARMVENPLLGDTKPERLSGHAKPSRTAGIPVGETAAGIVHDSVISDSGRTTARFTAPAAPDLTGAAGPPGTETTRTTPSGIASIEADRADPAAIATEPSDGVIRHIIATAAETAPAQRRRLPTDPPEDDRPDDAVGEITMPHARPTAEPRMSEPSILVSNLAVIHEHPTPPDPPGKPDEPDET